MNLYRIYCEEDGWIFVISEDVPTVCPIDGGHTIRDGSDVVVELDIKINDGGYHTALSLDNYKKLKINEIDIRTGELVGMGFTYNSKQFSLSATAQRNLLALELDKAILPYPLSWNTIDDLDKHDIADAAEASVFHQTALGTVETLRNSGTVLKNAVRAATDEAGVDAVIDDR